MIASEHIWSSLASAFTIGCSGRPLPEGVVSKPLIDAHQKGMLARLDFMDSLHTQYCEPLHD
jgi:hypothetical protein